MTYDQIVSTIMMRLGNRPQLKGLIEVELELLVTTEFEFDPMFKPWFLLSNEFQAIATVADQAYVGLPTDFLSENVPSFLWVENTSGARIPLVKVDYDLLISRNQDADGAVTTGLPTAYAILNDRIYLNPVPDAVYQLQSLYYQKSGFVKDDDTNGWVVNAPDLLIAAGVARVAQSIQNGDQFKLGEQQKQIARHRLMAITEERLDENQNTLMGDPI